MMKMWFYRHQRQSVFSYPVRPLGTLLVALLILVQPFLNNLVSSPLFQLANYGTDISGSALLSLTNQQRAGAGVAGLKDNAELDSAAHAKAADMFAKNYWAHDSPTGETPWDFMVAAGYHYSAAAENLAMDFNTSQDVINGWMNSTGHRENMLNGSYVDVGFAVMNGTLTGEQTTLVVMELGKPAITPPPQPAGSVKAPSAPAAGTSPQSPPQPSLLPMKTPTTAKLPALSPQVSVQAVNPNPLGSLAAFHATVQSVNWAQWTILIMTIAVLSLNYRPYRWRVNKRLPWYTRWLKAHPMFQLNLATLTGALMIGSSTGMLH